MDDNWTGDAPNLTEIREWRDGNRKIEIEAVFDDGVFKSVLGKWVRIGDAPPRLSFPGIRTNPYMEFSPTRGDY